MQNTPFRHSIALTGTLATDLLSPPELDGATGLGVAFTKTFLMLKQIKVVNTTAAPLPVSFFLGATAAAAAGTELGGSALSVPANDSIDISFPPAGIPVEVDEFVTGGSSGTGLTAIFMGEIGVRL